MTASRSTPFKSNFIFLALFTQNYLDHDQVSIRVPEFLDDYVEVRRLERSTGYQAGKRVFEQRMIYLGGGRERKG